MTEGNFGRCGKLHTLDWLFFLGYVLFLNLLLVLKLFYMLRFRFALQCMKPKCKLLTG